METTVLFKRNINGKVMYWKGSVVSAEGNVENCRLKYTYGELNTDNPIVTYSDKIEGKNIGKKNETTPYQQAANELKSVYNRQIKKGYKSLDTIIKEQNIDIKDINDLNYLIGHLESILPKYNTDANNCVKPMKCQTFKIDTFNYPCIIQPKINGVRAVIMLEEYTPQDLFSCKGVYINDKRYTSVIKTKEGLVYNVPHIEQLFNHLYSQFPQYKDIVFDGELYIKDEKVTTIGGAARNTNNPLNEQLLYVNFDLSVEDVNNEDRDKLRFKIWEDYINKNTSASYNIQAGRILINEVLNQHYLWNRYNIIVLNSDIANNDMESITYMECAISNGFEGAVIRDKKADYCFGQRPKTMMKLKKFKDSEFEIVDIESKGNPNDKVGFTIVYTLLNDINDLMFECNGTGTVEDKLNILNNKDYYKGKFATVKFYERTKNGIPFHANVIGIRDYE